MIKRVFLCLLFLLPLLPQNSYSDVALRIITPVDKGYMQGGQTLSVVSKITENTFDSLQIYVDGRVQKNLKDINGKQYVCSVVNVHPGINRIMVSGIASDGAPSSSQVSVFIISPISAQNNTPPDGYTQYLFHSSSSTCFTCHQMEPQAADDTPAKHSDSSCYTCHKEITDRPYVHGPTAAWACLMCHDPKATPKYATLSPPEKMCEQCHGDQIGAWQKLKHQHGPFALGMCTTCHSPHGSDWPFWTRKFPTDLCLSCHVGQTGDHIITFFNGQPHPIRGKPDPRHPGQELSCASCHSPHASPYRFQLFADFGHLRHFCMGCHGSRIPF
ncbi:MAG: cytochrome c3 family protein [Nitrospiraceae bacterium]|nr:cytochrome c3 family protein [Nitrospiraceae bacterium]